MPHCPPLKLILTIGLLSILQWISFSSTAWSKDVNIVDYGAVADGTYLSTPVTVTMAAPTTLNVPGANFVGSCSAGPPVVGDCGKTIVVSGIGPTSGPGASFYSTLVTTIDAVIDPTHVTVHDAAGVFVSNSQQTIMYYMTDNGTAINNAIAALGSQGGKVYLPAGVYGLNLHNTYHSIALVSNVTLQGAGAGRTVLLCDENVLAGGAGCITNIVAGSPATPPAVTNSAIRGITLQGSRPRGLTSTAAATAFPRPGVDLIAFSNVSFFTVEDCEALDSRGKGIDLALGSEITVARSRVMRTNTDGIAVWSAAKVSIVDNRIEQAGDDPISAHSGDSDPSPVRSSVTISRNQIYDAYGSISVLGAKSTQIDNNIIERAFNGIIVGAEPFFQ